MEQLITCINCPVGCRMTVNVEDGKVVSVTGNSCKRGVTYAAQESIAPMRMVTAVVPVAGRKMPVSVKTRTPIPKVLLYDADRIQEAASVELSAWGMWLPQMCAAPAWMLSPPRMWSEPHPACGCKKWLFGVMGWACCT